MVVGDEIGAIASALQIDGGFDRAEIVADMKLPRGLDAGENTHNET